MIVLKSPREIEKIRRACLIVAEYLESLKEHIQPGITTWDLNVLSEQWALERKARPAFKGYRGYPFALCTSVNEEVVHGMPSKERVLKDGDIVGVDFGIVLDGFYGDAAITAAVGTIGEEAERLLWVTRQALYQGIEKAFAGNRLSDISHAIQHCVESHGYSVVREFAGHGVGHKLHESPSIPNYGHPGRGVQLKPGMVLAIEPMTTQGSPGVKLKSDGWTAVTADGKLSAHFEHTVAVTQSGPEILSKL